MSIATPQELLDLLLEDRPLTAVELESFISSFEKEGQLFDYKDGILTGKPADAKKMLREYVSGFANAEGGVLILGVDEARPRRISPCQRIGQEPLDVWAQKVLTDMSGFFSPPPRFRVVTHAAGEVLLVAVARPPQFVPCVESRQLKYFLRIHETTIEVPSFLISDLVLGRRQHPILSLEPTGGMWRLELFGATRGPVPQFAIRNLRTSLLLENTSLVPAEEVEVGLVAWTLAEDEVRINSHLQAYVDANEVPQPPSRVGHLRWTLTHFLNQSRIQHVVPFRQIRCEIAGPTIPRDGLQSISCGLYLLAPGSPPTWFEMEVSSTGRLEPAGCEVLVPGDFSLKRLGTSRPRLLCRSSS